ncbi:helix-turn-helix transcriptional regulator [Thermoproteota archaeon]
MLQQRTKNKEKPAIHPENNNASTSEKCPERLQSMLEKEQLTKILGAENDSFSKISDLLAFQEQENQGFSSLLDNSRRLKHRKGPEYRKINRYYKSKSQYWSERNRRKKCWELSGQGLTYKQIAEKLGVSEKTVQRDIKKIQPYYFRLCRNYFSRLEQDRIKEFNAELEGKTLHQRFNILSKAMVEQHKLWKIREYRRHSQIISVDMTQQEYGLPKISFIPRGKQTLAYPYHIRVHVKANFEGKDLEVDVGGLEITQKTRNWW